MPVRTFPSSRRLDSPACPARQRHQRPLTTPPGDLAEKPMGGTRGGAREEPVGGRQESGGGAAAQGGSGLLWDGRCRASAEFLLVLFASGSVTCGCSEGGPWLSLGHACRVGGFARYREILGAGQTQSLVSIFQGMVQTSPRLGVPLGRTA